MDDGSIRGELAVYIADDFESRHADEEIRAPLRPPATSAGCDFDSDRRSPARDARSACGASIWRSTPPRLVLPAVRIAGRHGHHRPSCATGRSTAPKRLALDPPRHRRRHEPHRRKCAKEIVGPSTNSDPSAAELLRRGVVRHRGAGRSGVWPVAYPIGNCNTSGMTTHVQVDDRPDGRRNFQPLPLVLRIEQPPRAAGGAGRGGDAAAPATTPGTTPRRAAWS